MQDVIPPLSFLNVMRTFSFKLGQNSREEVIRYQHLAAAKVANLQEAC